MNNICLYVDNSNIFHEGQRFADKSRGEPRDKFRIYFKNFVKLLANNRNLVEVVWGGSIPPRNDDLWMYLQSMGIKPDLIPRSSSGENETIDHKIQLLMHRHVRRYREFPGTIVLATGDGKGYYRNEGFLYDIEGFVSDGWGIEVASWDHSCHRTLKQFAIEKGVYIKLDDFYDQISFIKDGRIVHRID